MTSLAYNTSLQVDLDGVNQKLSQIGQILPAPVQGLLAGSGLASLPANYTLNKKGTLTNGSLTAVWPIYMGGLANATRGFVSAQANEALPAGTSATPSTTMQWPLRHKNDLTRQTAQMPLRAVAQASHQFVAAQPGVFLSAEVLRMHRVALREGTGTALEVMDAQTNPLKVMTERAQIAYDYVLALAS